MGNADKADIRKVIEAYGDRLRASDVRGVVDLYTDECAVMTPELETIVGKHQLTEVYEGHLRDVALNVTFHFEEILADGDLGAAHTTATGTITPLATGEAAPARFRELFVLRREGEEWKIAQYMFQSMPVT
ncbi:MAG TPA: nuclear transport factor 2 family protein [Streptosporangiaceae bacterium]